jgi:hypothetical protein
MTEPTKACVRVLRIENIVIRALKFILWTIPYKILNRFEKVLKWVCKFVNWCIVRAIIRWVGFPISSCVIYYFVMVRLATLDVSFPEFFGWCSVIAVMLMVSVGCWTDIPEKEKDILFKE